MKDKILESQISDACETIARALRAYSGRALHCGININTREQHPEKGTDFYDFAVEDLEGNELLDLGMRIAYCWDDDNGGMEVIRETYKCYGGADDDPDE